MRKKQQLQLEEAEQQKQSSGNIVAALKSQRQRRKNMKLTTQPKTRVQNTADRPLSPPHRKAPCPQSAQRPQRKCKVSAIPGGRSDSPQQSCNNYKQIH